MMMLGRSIARRFSSSSSSASAALYKSQRKAALAEAIKQNVITTAYPSSFPVSCTIPEFVSKYDDDDNLTKTQQEPHNVVKIAGRMQIIRNASKNLMFYDVAGDGKKVQVKASKSAFSNPDTFKSLHSVLRRGDIVGITGTATRTAAGELSILASNVTLLSPCLHPLPTEYYGLKDKDSRYRKRYVDLMVNSDSRRPFVIRNRVIKYIRNFLDTQDFLEVETPIMNDLPGGALAKPFVTYANDNTTPLYLRIAPELYLKQLVIGGLDRVYEIGRQFRNEGTDTSHNPEFTSCEFYTAYHDYQDLIKMTEDLLRGMILDVTGSHVLKVNDIEVDFSKPFRRVSLIPTIENATGTKIPLSNMEETTAVLNSLVTKYNIQCGSGPRTASRLLDKLVGRFIESDVSLYSTPFFIVDHPDFMSPFAKSHEKQPFLTQRFELFIAGSEVCNAYTELNDPEVQRMRFEDQLRNRVAGDAEAPVSVDESFVTALEHGLPPTAGWGCGIDRIAMFLSNTSDIKDVLFFPAKPSVNITNDDH